MNFATFLTIAKKQSSVDVRGICSYPWCAFCNTEVRQVVIHIGVGFWLLVWAMVGNAKALKSGTSDRYRFPRFFFIYSLFIPIYYYEPSGSGNLLEEFEHRL